MLLFHMKIPRQTQLSMVTSEGLSFLVLLVKKKKHSFLKNITKFSGSISILVAKVLYPHFLVQQKHT